jgi:tRNA dimethylallyltransferase
MSKPKVIAIVGPTASGKTGLSIELAQKLDGEVISADSRQVYRGMDIGTGKVTEKEMAGVPHHLLDIRDPMEVYTGAEFVTDGTTALADILKRSRTPIVAGGTFFYLDLLRGKMQSAPVLPDQAFRDSLHDLSNATLLEQLYAKDPERAKNIDPHNRRRVIRALEVVHELGEVPKLVTTESPYEWLVIGITMEQAQLHENIKNRLHERMEQGMIEEAQTLHKAGVTYTRLDALGLEYRYLARYLQGDLTREEMMEQLETKIRQFAKRQLTWLKRDASIEWYALENRSAIFQRATTFLAE